MGRKSKCMVWSHDKSVGLSQRQEAKERASLVKPLELVALKATLVLVRCKR